MTEFDQLPFRQKYLEGEGRKRDIQPVSFNAEERAKLEELKKLFHCDQDSLVLKKCLEYVYGDVIHNPSRAAFFRWLSEVRRVRPGP